MSDVARLLLYALVSAISLALGWFSRAWFDGTLISQTRATEDTRVAVESAAGATASILVADQRARAAAQRVRYVTKVVPSDCPPGVGPVSPDLAEELRTRVLPGREDLE